MKRMFNEVDPGFKSRFVTKGKVLKFDDYTCNEVGKIKKKTNKRKLSIYEKKKKREKEKKKK